MRTLLMAALLAATSFTPALAQEQSDKAAAVRERLGEMFGRRMGNEGARRETPRVQVPQAQQPQMQMPQAQPRATDMADRGRSRGGGEWRGRRDGGASAPPPPQQQGSTNPGRVRPDGGNWGGERWRNRQGGDAGQNHHRDQARDGTNRNWDGTGGWRRRAPDTTNPTPNHPRPDHRAGDRDGRHRDHGWDNNDRRRDDVSGRDHRRHAQPGYDHKRKDWQRRNDWGHNNRGWDNRSGGHNRHGWNHGWRDNSRYDWWSYRNRYTHYYRQPRYYDPYGWGRSYSRFGVGSYLDQLYFGSRYWISDPWQYRLPTAPYGTRWVRYYDDVLLIDTETGEVIDVIHDFFW